MTETKQGGSEKRPLQMRAEDPSAPLGTARNPIKPGVARSDWDSQRMGTGVVHSDPDPTPQAR